MDLVCTKANKCGRKSAFLFTVWNCLEADQMRPNTKVFCWWLSMTTNLLEFKQHAQAASSVASSLSSALTYHFSQPCPATTVTSPDSLPQSTSNPAIYLHPWHQVPGQGQKRGPEDELHHDQVKKGRKARKCESVRVGGRKRSARQQCHLYLKLNSWPALIYL